VDQSKYPKNESKQFFNYYKNYVFQEINFNDFSIDNYYLHGTHPLIIEVINIVNIKIKVVMRPAKITYL